MEANRAHHRGLHGVNLLVLFADHFVLAGYCMAVNLQYPFKLVSKSDLFCICYKMFKGSQGSLLYPSTKPNVGVADV